MTCIFRRIVLSSRPRSFETSTPSNSTAPEVGSIRRSIVRPAVVFPHPDSPTKPSVSPSWMVKLMSSTALTQALVRWSSPERTGKYFTKRLTSTKVLRPLALLGSEIIAAHQPQRPRPARPPPLLPKVQHDRLHSDTASSGPYAHRQWRSSPAPLPCKSPVRVQSWPGSGGRNGSRVAIQ